MAGFFMHNFMFSKDRRDILVSSMLANEAKGNDCSNCSGTCCTFVSNSMQITPIEALEILADLEEKSLLNEETLARIEDTVRKYRLDYFVGTGKSEIRKTYTCPFFHHKSLGCGVSLSKKPYGCLAFNPLVHGQKEGGECMSSIKNLEKRDEIWENVENYMNSTLISELNLIWSKLPIPNATLEMYKNTLNHPKWRKLKFINLLEHLSKGYSEEKEI